MILALTAVLFIFLYFMLYIYNPADGDTYDPNDTEISFEKAIRLPRYIERQYPFNCKVVKINGLKIHYIDEGDPNAPYTVVMVNHLLCAI